MFKNLFSRFGSTPEIEQHKTNPQVIVDQPSEIVIRLVPDNEFKHYELFMTLAVIFLPIGASFLTSFLSTEDFSSRYSLLFSAIAFLGGGFLFLILALNLRRKILNTKIVRKSISLGEFKNKGSKDD